MNFSDLINRHRAEKSDLYKDRWTSDDLFVAWYNDAVSYAFQYRPELFSKTVLVKLQCGSLQGVPGFDRFLKLDSITNECGNTIATPPRVDEVSGNFFAGWVCPSPSPSIPTGWGFNPKIPDRFTVTPPVEQGADVYARVVVAHRPEPLCAADSTDDLCLDDSLYPHVMNYISAMMYGTEAESSPTSLTMMNLYLKMFWQAMGIQMKADQHFYSAAKNAG